MARALRVHLQVHRYPMCVAQSAACGTVEIRMAIGCAQLVSGPPPTVRLRAFCSLMLLMVQVGAKQNLSFFLNFLNFLQNLQISWKNSWNLLILEIILENPKNSRKLPNFGRSGNTDSTTEPEAFAQCHRGCGRCNGILGSWRIRFSEPNPPGGSCSNTRIVYRSDWRMLCQLAVFVLCNVLRYALRAVRARRALCTS